MAEHYCSHPTCYESEETATMYKEPTEHNEKGWMPVCGSHLSREKCEQKRVTVLSTGAAAEANAAVLAGLDRVD